jgi:hypothetical protein
MVSGAEIRIKMGQARGEGRNEKKEPPLPAAQSNNREASNRVDRSHSVSRRWTVYVIKGKA